MTKDFKQQVAASSGLNQYGMGWMLGGIAIGLLVGLALYSLSNKEKNTENATTPTTQPPQLGTAPNPSSNPALPQTGMNGQPNTPPSPSEEQPGFSYHAVLPQLEVGIPVTAIKETPPPNAKVEKKPSKPDAAIPTETPPTAETAATPVKFGKNNGFQLGSYKTEEQAIAAQTRARQGGLNGRIEKADVNGTTVYRLRLGPATNQEMLDKWQKALSGMGVTPLPVHM